MEANAKWQVSGSAAERYEKFLVPVIFVPWAEHLLTLAELKPDTALLDVACGTGIVARMARDRVGRGGRITGIDLNPDMLATARQAAPDKSIEWINGDATKLPFADDSFDVLTCQQGLQFFPDKPAALADFRRVLKPGGLSVQCIARGVSLNPLMSSQIAALEKHFGDETSGAIKAVCQLSDADEILGLFTAAGFTDVTVESEELTLHHPDALEFVTGMVQATPAAGAIAALPVEQRNQIVQDILHGFGGYFDGKALAFPHVSHVVTARA